MLNITNDMDLIDSRAIEKRIIELEKELKVLKGLGHEYTKFPGEIADWMNGILLIRDSFFNQHARQIAEDRVDINLWPTKHIDWDAAAAELLKLYRDVDFNGAVYWIEKPSS